MVRDLTGNYHEPFMGWGGSGASLPPDRGSSASEKTQGEGFVEGPNYENDQFMALVADIRSDSLPGSLCAGAHVSRGDHPNAHRHTDAHLAVAFANIHVNAYAAATPPSRYPYSFHPGLV